MAIWLGAIGSDNARAIQSLTVYYFKYSKGKDLGSMLEVFGPRKLKTFVRNVTRTAKDSASYGCYQVSFGKLATRQKTEEEEGDWLALD